jgi:Phosphotransferase system, mannose/fructose-specific component IIA
MFKIILISHGEFVLELVKSAEMIAGELKDVQTFGIATGCDIDEFKQTVEIAIKNATNNDELLVLTDIMYGSPFNVVASLMDKYDFQHFSGINLPILLEIIVSRKHSGLSKVIEIVNDISQTTFVHVNELIKKEKI